jgi:FAD/FMN-containing dehydrogenase
MSLSRDTFKSAINVKIVTGTCECVSYLGPGLGGGHGWLQGRHGLVSDQFVSWNVVLANGTLITVDENSDLYWGMKGAGHNFGIVTSMTSKVYDIVYPNYGLETLIFSGDQVEDVYRIANEQWLDGNKTMPIDLINWSYWFYDPTTSDKVCATSVAMQMLV